LVSPSGRVFIVGAGPGDPELLTRKAFRLLCEADIVVFDKLVSEAILDLIPQGTARVFAGKVARHHHMPQSEINALLVTLAGKGRTVVRLKGGDPFMFGRGGEEAEHLSRSGVPYEVIPGVTSASGCSSYSGIPLTHRGLSHSVHFVTGHAKDDEPLDLDWSRLADPATTLVIFMGRTNIRRIADALIEHGLDEKTPAAAIVNGTLPDQQTITTTLSHLPDIIDHIDLAAPTMIIIGKVVSLASRLVQCQPLKNQSDQPIGNEHANESMSSPVNGR